MGIPFYKMFLDKFEINQIWIVKRVFNLDVIDTNYTGQIHITVHSQLLQEIPALT